MSKQAVEAIRADRAALLELGRSLSDEEWARPSDCDGWRVQDVVAHMATVFRQVVDPSSLPPGDPADVEASAELWVADRKDWSPADVLAEYETLGEQALEILASMQTPEMEAVLMPLGNLGTHPLPILADALAFDHYTHIRVDLLAPTGPLDRPAPPSDELRLGPTVDWMLAGLPQMCAEQLAGVGGTVTLVLDGPGADSLTVGDGEPVATVRGSTADFVLWGTKRRPWRGFDLDITGDEVVGERFLDAVNII